MAISLFISIACAMFVASSGTFDYKYANHRSYVSKRCPGVSDPTCCYWARPCAITYNMRYYRSTRVDTCSSPTSCRLHCRRHRTECLQNCDEAMAYSERSYKRSDKCKCVTRASFLRTAQNECYRSCRTAYNSCVWGCQSGPLCPIRVFTSVDFRDQLDGRCTPKCIGGSCGRRVRKSRRDECFLPRVPVAFAPKSAAPLSDENIAAISGDEPDDSSGDSSVSDGRPSEDDEDGDFPPTSGDRRRDGPMTRSGEDGEFTPRGRSSRSDEDLAADSERDGSAPFRDDTIEEFDE